MVFLLPNNPSKVGSDSKVVTVANVKPTISALTISGTSGVACLAGNAVSLSFTVSDPADNSADPISGTINWGDGSTTTYSGRSYSGSHTYSAGGHTITQVGELELCHGNTSWRPRGAPVLRKWRDSPCRD